MSLGPMRVPRLPTVLLTTSAASADSGPILVEAKGFEHWAFQLTGTFTNYSVTIYGTLDPNAVMDDGSRNSSYPAPGSPGGAWAVVPAPSEQSGTGAVNNPLTAITQVLETKIPWVAIWIHATGTGPTGTVNCVGWAID